MAFRDFLRQRATLEAGTVSATSDTGEETITWAASLLHVAVLIRLVSPRVDVRLGLSEAATHMALSEVLPGIDLTAGHWRFVMETPPAEVGHQYLILGAHNPGHQDKHWSIPVRRLA